MEPEYRVTKYRRDLGEAPALGLPYNKLGSTSDTLDLALDTSVIGQESRITGLPLFLTVQYSDARINLTHTDLDENRKTLSARFRIGADDEEVREWLRNGPDSLVVRYDSSQLALGRYRPVEVLNDGRTTGLSIANLADIVDKDSLSTAELNVWGFDVFEYGVATPERTGDIYELLYASVIGMMKAKAVSILKDEILAEDIAHNIWLRVLENSPESTGGSFLSYVITAAKNEAFKVQQKRQMDNVPSEYEDEKDEDIFRVRQIRSPAQFLVASTENVRDQSPLPDEVAIEGEMWDRFGGVLSFTSPFLRAALELRVRDGHSFKDVGATLGITDDAAQKRVDRAREYLRNWQNYILCND
tara:strand:+ start:36591 stop:37664 length:1074 start_codon:yes stop_codon:yes gene_type:complete